MRPVISYDDITDQNQPDAPQLGPQIPSTNQPPAKKRKTNQKAHQRRGGPAQHVQHWDEPANHAPTMNYGDDSGDAPTGAYQQDPPEEAEEEESRELTHDEIWDDSVLIEAWNSASAEYEAFHGKTKKWKEEPVKKSPLWYNIPPPSKKSADDSAAAAAKGHENGATEQAGGGDADSTPLNFDTFVPTHDPSLTPSVPAIPGADYMSAPPGGMVGQDEAFSRALSAMYWGGYWTAVYHYHRNVQSQEEAGDAGEEGEEEGYEGDEGMEDMISTQR